MGKLIAKLNATDQLTKETRRWIKDHAVADAKRFEQAKKEVEAIKKRLSLSSAELRGILDQGDDPAVDIDY